MVFESCKKRLAENCQIMVNQGGSFYFNLNLLIRCRICGNWNCEYLNDIVDIVQNFEKFKILKLHWAFNEKREHNYVVGEIPSRGMNQLNQEFTNFFHLSKTVFNCRNCCNFYPSLCMVFLNNITERKNHRTVIELLREIKLTKRSFIIHTFRGWN